jgi:hypothetical protein
MRRQSGETALGLPFLATIVHAVGLNVMNPSERKRDVLEASTRAVRDMIAMSWSRPGELIYRRFVATRRPGHTAMAATIMTLTDEKM